MKKYFFTGLVALLPITVTIWLVVFAVNFLSNPFLGLAHTTGHSFNYIHEFWENHPYMMEIFTRITILISLFCGVLLIGFLANLFITHTFFNTLEKILHKIPFVKSIYKTSQQVITTLIYSKKQSFQKVVLVPFPSTDKYSIGLIAGQPPTSCQKAFKKELISVLVPSCPNPISGFILMYPQKDIVHTDISVEEALKYIISCGMLQIDFVSKYSLENDQ